MQYRVCGSFPYRDVAPGDTFEAESSDVLTGAVAGGFIEPVESKTPAKPSGKAKTPPAQPAKKEN